MKNINKTIIRFFSIFFLLFSTVSNAQLTVKKSSIDSGGAISQSGTLASVYSIGEIAVSEYTNEDLSLSEGFISPNLYSTIGIEDYAILENVQVFPNPTPDMLQIKFSKKSTYQVEIYTTEGKRVFSSIVDEKELSVDVNQYLASTYIIIIKDTLNKAYKSYKFIKK